MRCRAALAWRSPPRDNRWRWVLPDEAGTGAAPHRAANEASEDSRSGLFPAVISGCAATSGPTPYASRRAGPAAVTRVSRWPVRLRSPSWCSYIIVATTTGTRRSFSGAFLGQVLRDHVRASQERMTCIVGWRRCAQVAPCCAANRAEVSSVALSAQALSWNRSPADADRTFLTDTSARCRELLSRRRT